MSETLRDLVVSLSLQTDNFTRNIRSVNKQIAEAESKFKLAAAGGEGFEKTAAGLSTQLSTLERRLSLQKDAVTQYERALTAANSKLQECFTRQTDYAQRLTDARTAQQALKEQVAAAAQQVRVFSQTLGENDSATLAAKANLDALKTEYRASVQEVKKLAGQNTALSKSTQNAADAVSTASTNLNKARAAVKTTQAEIDKCNQALRLAQTNWDAAGKAIEDSRAAIATFGKQIGLAESKFKLATAGIKELDTSVTGLSAKLTLLGEKLALQQQSVAQYENALRGAREQLIAAQQASDPEKIRQANDAVIDAEAALNRAKAAVASTRAEIEQTNKQLVTAKSAWTAAGKELEAFGKKCETVSRTLTAAGRTLSTAMTAPILSLGAAAIKASVSYESAFTSVRKTVDATEAQYESLSSEIKQMSTEVATSANDIAEVVAIAGQLGIETDYLTEFARTMIDLGNSTDIVADEAASVLAKFANITGMNQSEFDNLGASLVDLGNNCATTESAIMNMAMRLAAAGTQVGLSESQILGFAAALSSVGIEAEMGGSAFSKALVNMEVAAATGGEALEDFARVSGMTAEGFKALWDRDPASAFQAFIVGLSRMDEEGASAIATLNEIGINEIRLRDTLLRATNATELFAETQAMANAAWEENVALTEEAGKRYATTESRLVNLKNKAVLFGQQIGDDLNPMIQNLIDGTGELLDKFLEMDEAQRMQVIRYAAIAASIGPVLLLMGKVSKGVGTLSTGIGKFATAVGKAGGGWSGFLSVLAKSPAVWLAVAAAVVAGTVALVDYVSSAKQAREALEGMNETAKKWKDTAAETFYGKSEGLSFFGMSDNDFVRQTQSAQDWLDGLLKVWTDGEKESDEIVSHWTESFRSLTASTREELQALKDTADQAGYTYDDFDRMTSVKYDTETTPRYEFKYGANGEAAEVVDHELNRTARTDYDQADRPCQTELRDGATGEALYKTNLKYNKLNQLEMFSEQAGGEAHKTEFAYDRDNRVTGITYDGGAHKVNYTYDELGRVASRVAECGADAGKLTSTYEYVDGGYGTNSTTPLVKKIAQNGVSFEYEYDTRGNITSEKRGDLTTTYQYDALGQMIRVNDPHENATWIYNYDRGGNITSKVKYAYTTGTVGTAIETIPYVYGDNNWKDKLTSYNGQTITYDAIGNPTNDGTWTYTWQAGRQLKQMSAEGTSVSFKYDHNGMRVQKVVEQSWYPETTNYIYHGKLLTHMTVDYTDFDEVTHQDKMHFFYDVMSKPLLVKFNEETYIYLHNSLGDIVGLLDCAGNLVVEYKYDVWGKLLSITGTHSDTLGKRNPFRYRGYIYDSETEFYYLNCRYYSPKLKRFINSEEPIHDTSDPLEPNTFAYCFNDPLNNVDEDGEWGMPNWMKVAVGVVAIAGLAVATACTGGAAAVVCGAALTGALSGGAVGAASGAIAGAIEGGLDGAIDGACTGFVTGTLIGGASGAVCSGINIARGTTQIIGKAHGSLLHRFSSNMHAGRMSIFGRYSKIGLNRSLKTLGMVGRQRPDVIGIARGLGQANKIIEVVSRTQTVRQLSEKVTTMLSKNPNTVGGVVRWVAHVDRVIHFIKKLF